MDQQESQDWPTYKKIAFVAQALIVTGTALTAIAHLMRQLEDGVLNDEIFQPLNFQNKSSTSSTRNYFD